MFAVMPATTAYYQLNYVQTCVRRPCVRYAAFSLHFCVECEGCRSFQKSSFTPNGKDGSVYVHVLTRMKHVDISGNIQIEQHA